MAWAEKWKLKFHPDKFKVMYMGKSNKEHIYHMEGKIIANSKIETDLWVIVDDKLKLREHMNRRNFLTLNGKGMCRVFNTMAIGRRPVGSTMHPPAD